MALDTTTNSNITLRKGPVVARLTRDDTQQYLRTEDNEGLCIEKI